MTTFRKVIMSSDWDKVSVAFTKHYSQYADKIDVFREIYEGLKTLKPEPSDFEIIAEYCEDLFDKTPYYSVSGIKNGTRYAIELTPWEMWLGSKIHKYALQICSKAEFVAHCLWEMTYYGGTQEKIAKFREELQYRYENAINNPGDLVTWDQIKKELNNDSNSL